MLKVVSKRMKKDESKGRKAWLAGFIAMLLSLALFGGYFLPSHSAFAEGGPESLGGGQTFRFTVTYDADGGKGAVPEDKDVYGPIGQPFLRVKDGSSLDREGQMFIGWAVNGEGRIYYAGMKYEILSDTVFVAQYGDPDDYVLLTHDANNGGGRVYWYIKKETEPVLGDAELFDGAGAAFAGWSANPQAKPGDDGIYLPGAIFSRMHADATVYAIWQSPEWEVRFVPGIGGSFSPDVRTVFSQIADGTLFDAAVAAPKPIAAEGYRFTGWDNPFPHTITSNLTFVAHFEEQAPAMEYVDKSHITIAAGDAEKVYDGTPLEEGMAAVTSGVLKPGDSVQATMTADSVATDVGTVDNVIESYIIARAGTDVTDEYDVTLRDGSLTITPAILTLIVEDITLMPGDPMPTNFKIEVEGLVGDDKEADVLEGLDLDCKVDYRPDAPVGTTFFIRLEVEGLADDGIHGNYAISANSGLLNVTWADGTTIGDEEAPLSWLSRLGDELVHLASFSVWALLNLILTIVTGLVMAALFVIEYRRRKAESWESQSIVEYVKSLFSDWKTDMSLRLRLATAGATAIAIALFTLTVDLSLPMVIADRWTALHFGIAAVTVVLAVFSDKVQKEERLGKEQA